MVEIVGREHDRQMRPVFPQQLRDVDPVQMGQHDVEHEDVRPELANSDRYFPADRHDLHVVLVMQRGVVVLTPTPVIDDKKHPHDK